MEAKQLETPTLHLVTSPGAALATALAKAQGAMSSVGKDRKVDQGKFSYTYATLAAIWDVIRGPLAANGLAIVQLPTVANDKHVAVETRLLHLSGESISSTCVVPVTQTTPQGIGSAITYARRYGLSAMLGVVSEDDDDGVAASAPQQGSPSGPQSQRTPPAAAKPAAAAPTPISATELDMQFRSCTTVAELTMVAARVSAAGVTPTERAALLATFNGCKAVLGGATP